MVSLIGAVRWRLQRLLYRWIRNELYPSRHTSCQNHLHAGFKKSEAKQRLFNEFNSGKVRILIGSSETMGTGVNVQTRLAALHHLDVPWLKPD